MPTRLQISLMLSFPSSARRFASSICPSLMLFFLPPLRPLALAAESPASVRSRMMSRSSSAINAVIRKKNFPIAVEVSIFSFKLSSSTPRFFKSSASSMRCFVERLARSNFQMTSVSPFLRWSRQLSHSGRLAFAPLSPWSQKMRWQGHSYGVSHPSSFSASICKSKSCSKVEPRA